LLRIKTLQEISCNLEKSLSFFFVELRSIISSYINSTEYKEINNLFTKLSKKLPMYAYGLLPLIESSNMTKNSLIALHIIRAAYEIMLNEEEGKRLLQVTRNFLECFDPQQIQLVPQHFANLSFLFCEYLLKRKVPRLGIFPLRQAILRYGQKEGEITTLHRDFALLCLKGKFYIHSLPIITQTITTFDKSKGTLSPIDIAVYNYYRGLLFTGLQRFEEAMGCFKMAITQPSNIIHLCFIESYKKLLLLSLITKEKPPILPRYTANRLKIVLEGNLDIYKEIIDMVTKKSSDKQKKNLNDEKKKKLEKDNNLGLFKLLVKTQNQNKLKQLKDTYLTADYKDITNQVEGINEKEMELSIFEMIKTGDLNAKIDQKAKVISYLEGELSKEATTHKTAQLTQIIEAQTTEIIRLAELVRQKHESLKKSSDYIRKNLMDVVSGDAEIKGMKAAEMID